MALLLIFTTVLLLLPSNSHGWTQLPSSQTEQRQLRRRIPLGARSHLPLYSSSTSSSSSSSSSSTESSPSSVMGGVSDFEKWFGQLEKSRCVPDIKFDSFECGTLRGLAWNAKSFISPLPTSPNTKITTVPKSVVLGAPYKDDDWDSQLALKLWNEIEKGKDSEYYGYCSLLTSGEINTKDASSASDWVPPSTAPNALRHWTESELNVLSSASPRGQRLLRAKESQEKEWKQKYNNEAVSSKMTFSQFEWAMEVVHSRAFKGVGSSSSSSGDGIDISPGPMLMIGALAPVVSAIAAYVYSADHEVSLPVYVALGVLAVGPAFYNLLSGDDDKNNAAAEEAVLLPLIDSANHLEEADSKIEYNPLSGGFELTVGPNCFLPADGSPKNAKYTKDGKKKQSLYQLYISYGRKSDPELLLNYGFLRDVPVTTPDDMSAHRIKLAKAFGDGGGGAS